MFSQESGIVDKSDSLETVLLPIPLQPIRKRLFKVSDSDATVSELQSNKKNKPSSRERRPGVNRIEREGFIIIAKLLINEANNQIMVDRPCELKVYRKDAEGKKGTKVQGIRVYLTSLPTESASEKVDIMVFNCCDKNTVRDPPVVRNLQMLIVGAICDMYPSDCLVTNTGGALIFEDKVGVKAICALKNRFPFQHCNEGLGEIIFKADYLQKYLEKLKRKAE